MKFLRSIFIGSSAYHRFGLLAAIGAYFASFKTHGKWEFAVAALLGLWLLQPSLIGTVISVATSAGLFAVLYFSNNHTINTQLAVAVVLVGLWFPLITPITNFGVRSFQKASAYLLSFFAAMIVGGLIQGCFFAIEKLFNTDIPNEINNFSPALAAFALCAFYGTLQNQSILQKANLENLLNKIRKFVHVPFYLLYTLVLFVYELKLLFSWNSPQGYASIPASVALVLWVMIDAIKPISDDQESVLSKLPVLVKKLIPLIPLGLLIYGVSVRINAYGLTPDRIYLALWCIIATTAVCLNLIKNKNNWKYLTLAASAALLVLCIPPIDINKITAWDQGKRGYTASKEPELKANCFSFDDNYQPYATPNFPNFKYFESNGDYIDLGKSELKFEFDRTKATLTLSENDKTPVVFNLKELINKETKKPFSVKGSTPNHSFEIIIAHANLCDSGSSFFTGFIFYK